MTQLLTTQGSDASDANDAAGFEPAFERVHHGFHALMGEHEGHEAHR